MKIKVLIIVLFSTVTFFSQKKVDKKFQTKSKEIEISTFGLDDFVLENSTSNFIEIYLYSENSNEKDIVFNDKNNIVKLKFTLESFKTEETVFRKFITKRLHKANAIVKIPKDFKVTIFGENVNITSKSYNGSISLFLEKGIVKLNTIRKNAKVKMYSGTITAIVKETNIDVVSNLGKIKINKQSFIKKYKKENTLTSKKIDIKTIKANIYLTSK